MGSRPSRGAAFTLLELLTVIAIIGILAALALPTIHTFRPNIGATASQQLLSEVARARQLAISQRTTVFMIFVPTNFWNDAAYGVNWTAADRTAASNLFDKQLVAYTFVSLRSLGDQPGSTTVRYLAPWRTLPSGSYIPIQKFRPRNLNQAPVLGIDTNRDNVLDFRIFGFNETNNIPFPMEQTLPTAPNSRTWCWLPYISFNHLGQLACPYGPDGKEYLPIAQGGVGFVRDAASRIAQPKLPNLTEAPPGNITNSYNLVAIDWLTGRARIEHARVQ